MGGDRIVMIITTEPFKPDQHYSEMPVFLQPVQREQTNTARQLLNHAPLHAMSKQTH